MSGVIDIKHNETAVSEAEIEHFNKEVEKIVYEMTEFFRQKDTPKVYAAVAMKVILAQLNLDGLLIPEVVVKK